MKDQGLPTRIYKKELSEVSAINKVKMLHHGASFTQMGVTTECRATLDHLLYMCQNLFKNEA